MHTSECFVWVNCSKTLFFGMQCVHVSINELFEKWLWCRCVLCVLNAKNTENDVHGLCSSSDMDVRYFSKANKIKLASMPSNIGVSHHFYFSVCIYCPLHMFWHYLYVCYYVFSFLFWWLIVHYCVWVCNFVCDTDLCSLSV